MNKEEIKRLKLLDLYDIKDTWLTDIQADFIINWTAQRNKEKVIKELTEKQFKIFNN